MVSKPSLSNDHVSDMFSNSMSSSSMSVVSSSLSQNMAFMPTFSSAVTEKLNRNNYSLWLAQIVPWLKIKNLMGFVDGTSRCPPEFLSVDAWKALEKRFASSSQHRIQQFLATLYQTTRGESSVSEFLERINQVADQLALAGQPVSDSQLVMIIMQNIGPKFEITVSSAQARENPIEYDDLVALLLNAEQRLNSVENERSSPVALFTPNRGRGSNNLQPWSLPPQLVIKNRLRGTPTLEPHNM